MSIQERYRQQVFLLLQALPVVDKEVCFALKGGTAINLFVRNLPRLSVDIDLVYQALVNYLSVEQDLCKGRKGQTVKVYSGFECLI